MSTSPPTPMTKSESRLCRICFSLSTEDLIRVPCKCSGTVGFVHHSCFGRWILAVRNNVCEICHSKYDDEIVITRRRNFKQMFYSFFNEPLTAIFKFAVNFLSSAGVGFFIVRKLLIISDSFTVEDDDDKINEFLNVLCLTTGIGSYVLLLDVTYQSFRELLTKLSNWWRRGGTFIIVQMPPSIQSINNALLRPPLL